MYIVLSQRGKLCLPLSCSFFFTSFLLRVLVRCKTTAWLTKLILQHVKKLSAYLAVMAYLPFGLHLWIFPLATVRFFVAI